MKIHLLQHVAFEGPGHIAEWAKTRDHGLTRVRLYRGERLPTPSAIEGLVVMGGPMSVNDEADHPWLVPEKRFVETVMRANRPVVGICLGAQLIASALGSRVYRNSNREIGWFPVEKAELPASAASPVATAFPKRATAFHWHGETFDLPRGATHLGRSAGCLRQAFLWGDRALGLQFHFEVTPGGAQQLIRRCSGDLTPGRFVQTASEMLGNPARFERANRQMDALLDAMFSDGRLAEKKKSNKVSATSRGARRHIEGRA